MTNSSQGFGQGGHLGRQPAHERQSTRTVAFPRKATAPSEPGRTNPSDSDDDILQESHVRLLACPFWAMNPCMYSECYRHVFKRTTDVTVHLISNHQNPYGYCRKCLRIYPDKESAEEHRSIPMRCRYTAVRPGSSIDIFLRQRNAICGMIDRTLSEEQQWFRIWDIIFPEKPHPVSAYRYLENKSHAAKHTIPAQDTESWIPFHERTSGDGRVGPNTVLSAYTCFANEQRGNIHEDRPYASFGEIEWILVQRWEALTDEQRATYEAKTRELQSLQSVIPSASGGSPFVVDSSKPDGNEHDPELSAGTHFDRPSPPSACLELEDFLALPEEQRSRNPSPDSAFRDIELEGLLSDRVLPPPKQDLPFTESGYASGFNHDHLRHTYLQDTQREDDVVRDGNSDRNVKTSYSEASTVALDQAQRYISELCGSIHNEISGHIDRDNWPSLSKRLAELIKAFAVKLGLESSTQINRDIMYFIHKRGREIAKQLDSVVLSVNAQTNVTEEGGKEIGDNMSLVDKMNLWTRKVEETQTSVNASELFVGVNETDEVIDTLELPNYNKIIMESNSFKWLVESLRKELTLRWGYDESEACNHRETIRHEVLQKLPTGIISKTRPPTTHDVTFRLTRLTSLDQNDFRTYKLQMPPSDAIAVTYCSGDAQASSIAEYMEQTWPSTWKKIFNLLQVVTCGARSDVYADILHDKTQISASVEYDDLVVRVVGPAHTIAECGEQLAWLQAASRPSYTGRGEIVQQIPLIFYMANMRSSQKTLCFNISVRRTGSVPVQQRQWTEILRRNDIVVVPGYPILRRPAAFRGIEVSPQSLLESVGNVFITTFKDGSMLNGSRTSLALVKQTQNIYLWHEIKSARSTFCHCVIRWSEENRIESHAFDLPNIKTGRHIIVQCEERRGDEDNDASDLSEASVIECNRSPCLNDPSFLGREEQRTETPKSTALPMNCTLANGDMVSSFASEADTNSWISSQEAPGSATCRHPGGSTESSLDSDLLSMSDSSEDFEPLDDNDPIRTVVNVVVSRLVSGYRSVASGEVSPGSNRYERGTATLGLSQDTTTPSGPAKQCRKRKRDRNDDSDSEDGTLHPSPSKRSKQERHIKLLACPFWKMSLSKHTGCSKYQLKRIRDVKQHLKRKHTPDDYCRRCLSIFPSEGSLVQHMSQPEGFVCELAPQGTTLEGLSQRQSKDLSRKSKPGLSDEQQWFAIWDIAFPGKQRPDSAYLDSAVARQTCLIREHCRRYGEPLLVENLQAAGLWDHPEMTAERRGQVLSRIVAESFDSICDSFSPNVSSESEISRSTRHSFQSKSHDSAHNETPAASLVDSGIGLGSQAADTRPRPSLFTTPNDTQQEIRPGATEIPPCYQATTSEERVEFGLNFDIGRRIPGTFDKSSRDSLRVNRDQTSTQWGIDEPRMDNFYMSGDSAPKLSLWDFQPEDWILNEGGVENICK